MSVLNSDAPRGRMSGNDIRKAGVVGAAAAIGAGLTSFVEWVAPQLPAIQDLAANPLFQGKVVKSVLTGIVTVCSVAVAMVAQKGSGNEGNN